MPEGPEIRREADRIGAALVGQRAREVSFAFEHLAPFQSKLSGRTVEAVDSRGKALLVHFSGGWVVYSHNQLYGRWMVRRAGSLPVTRRQLRLAIHNRDHSALLYSASEIAVLREEQLGEHPYLARLGPDLLARDTQPARIARRLASPAFRRRSLGALLLDQGFVAGIGNYLRSEILFEAGLHPDLRPQDLDDDRRHALARAIRGIGRRAYRQKGVTVAADAFRAHKAAGERRGQARFQVFARAGRPCRACGGRIARTTRVSRRLYLCSRCQPAPRRRAPRAAKG